jgi:hypothetical protein
MLQDATYVHSVEVEFFLLLNILVPELSTVHAENVEWPKHPYPYLHLCKVCRLFVQSSAASANTSQRQGVLYG